MSLRSLVQTGFRARCAARVAAAATVRRTRAGVLGGVLALVVLSVGTTTAPDVGLAPDSTPDATSDAHPPTGLAPRASLTATPAAARVGDRITITLRIDTPALLHVDWPDVTGRLDPAAVIEVDDARPAPPLPGPRATESGWAYARRIDLQPTIAGPLRVPPLEIRCTPVSAAQDDATISVVTPELLIPVAGVLTAADDPLRPRDVSGPLSPPAAPARWPWLAGVAAAFLVVAGAIVLRSQRRRTPRRHDPVAAALASLDALARELRDGRGTFDAYVFHHRLADVVRTFLDRRYAIPAPELTTPELLRDLARGNGARAALDRDRLGALLRACDRVKYAAAPAAQSEAAAAVAEARKLVEAPRAAPPCGDACDAHPARGGGP